MVGTRQLRDAGARDSRARSLLAWGWGSTRWKSCFGLLCSVRCAAGAQDTHLLVITGVSGGRRARRAVSEVGAPRSSTARRSAASPTRTSPISRKRPRQTTRATRRAPRARASRRRSPTSPRRAKPNDEVFILLIGHGSFDGKVGAFNLPGPDLTVADFGELLDKLSRSAWPSSTPPARAARSSAAHRPEPRHRHRHQDRRRAQRHALPGLLRRSARAAKPPTATGTAASRSSRRSTTPRRRS